GAKFSTTASAHSTISFRTKATARGSFRLKVALRLPTLSVSYSGDPSSPWGFFGPSAMTRRKSGRLADSMRSTVAPCSAKERVGVGPGARGPELQDVHAGPRAGAVIDAGRGQRGGFTGPGGLTRTERRGGLRDRSRCSLVVGTRRHDEAVRKAAVPAERREEVAG